MGAGLGDEDDTTPHELVHFVTQQTRFTLITNILQHPEQLPSMCELKERNPSVSEATVYRRSKPTASGLDPGSEGRTPE